MAGREALNRSSKRTSILRKSLIEVRRRHKNPPLPVIVKPQPLRVPDDISPPTEVQIITEEGTSVLIEGYNSQTLRRWQQSIVEQSSLKTTIDDGFLFLKLRQRFFNLNKRVPNLKDLIEMSDQILEEVMGGQEKKEEMMKIRQSMVRHNVLPSDSQIVFEIDLLGLSEKTREILVDLDIKTIESVCQIIKKETEQHEQIVRVTAFAKDRLLKFIQELAEWEKMNPSPGSLSTDLKQRQHLTSEEKQQQIINKLIAVEVFSDDPVVEIKNRLAKGETIKDIAAQAGIERTTFGLWLRTLGMKKGKTEKLKKTRGKKQTVLEQYGLKDKDGKVTESWPILLGRLCGDLPLREVAISLNITIATIIHWRKQAGFPRRSVSETRKLNLQKLNPGKKPERRKRKILAKFSPVEELRDDPVDYIKQRITAGVTVKDLLKDLQEKGVKIKTTSTLHSWLKTLDIPIVRGFRTKIGVYNQARQAGLLERLTPQQRKILELVFDRGFSIHKTAYCLTEDNNKKVTRQSVAQLIIRAVERLETLLNVELTGEKSSQPLQIEYLYQILPNGVLTTRMVNALLVAGFTHLDQLLSMTPDDIRWIRKIGQKGEAALSGALDELYPERKEMIAGQIIQREKEKGLIDLPGPFHPNILFSLLSDYRLVTRLVNILLRSGHDDLRQLKMAPIDNIMAIDRIGIKMVGLLDQALRSLFPERKVHTDRVLEKWTQWNINRNTLNTIDLSPEVLEKIKKAGFDINQLTEVNDACLSAVIGWRHVYPVRRRLLDRGIISPNSTILVEIDLLPLLLEIRKKLILNNAVRLIDLQKIVDGDWATACLTEEEMVRTKEILMQFVTELSQWDQNFV